MTMNELKYDRQDSAKLELFATHRPCAKALSLICVFLFQYICENHFQRLAKRSMFTGLKAINHFGRPDMPAFLKFVQKKHSYVSCNNCSINSLIKKSWFFLSIDNEWLSNLSFYRSAKLVSSVAVRVRSPTLWVRHARLSTGNGSCPTSSTTTRISAEGSPTSPPRTLL